LGEWQVAWKERQKVIPQSSYKVKTLSISIVAAIVILMSLSTHAFASTEPGRQDSSRKITETEEARIIKARLGEINAMDKSSLTESELKDLEKEVKVSQRRMKKINGGVFSSYFSELFHRFNVATRF
jgi:hypothetical protein